MEINVFIMKVNLRTHLRHKAKRRGQSSETAIEASTRTEVFFTNDRTLLIGSKRRHFCFDDVTVGRRADVHLLALPSVRLSPDQTRRLGGGSRGLYP
jgi:hypothetical protein